MMATIPACSWGQEVIGLVRNFDITTRKHIPCKSGCRRSLPADSDLSANVRLDGRSFKYKIRLRVYN